MSNISDRHNFVTYKSTGSDKTVAFSGQRLSIVRFKADSEGKKLMDTQACSIPLAELTLDDCQNLITHINSWFRSVQDEITRDACVRGESCVTDTELSPNAIAVYLNLQAAGERLTGELIREWFTQELQDTLCVAFADRLGIGDAPTDAETEKLSQMCTVYRDAFVSLTGGRTHFPADKRAKLVKALELVDCTSGIAQRLVAKLNAMANVSVEEMLGL